VLSEKIAENGTQYLGLCNELKNQSVLRKQVMHNIPILVFTKEPERNTASCAVDKLVRKILYVNHSIKYIYIYIK
jgi:hypothetical protein